MIGDIFTNESSVAEGLKNVSELASPSRTSIISTHSKISGFVEAVGRKLKELMRSLSGVDNPCEVYDTLLLDLSIDDTSSLGRGLHIRL